jgi:hypothetical protein
MRIGANRPSSSARRAPDDANDANDRADARSRASDARRDAVDEAIRDAIVVGDS